MSKMTSKEIAAKMAQAISSRLKPPEFIASEWVINECARIASELMAAEQGPVATRKAIQDWWWSLGDRGHRIAFDELMIECFTHFTTCAAELPPICGMSEGEIEAKMLWGFHGLSGNELRIIQHCARVAYGLAQPAQQRDDTNARMCAFAFYKVTEPGWNEQDCAEAWDREPEEGKNGWRAVAAMMKEIGE